MLAKNRDRLGRRLSNDGDRKARELVDSSLAVSA